MGNKDWRLKKMDTININPSQETLKIDVRESRNKDKQLMLGGNNDESMNDDEPKGWIDDNVEAVKREKDESGQRPKRRQLMKKNIDSFEELDVDVDKKVVKRKTVKKGQ